MRFAIRSSSSSLSTAFLLLLLLSSVAVLSIAFTFALQQPVHQLKKPSTTTTTLSMSMSTRRDRTRNDIITTKTALRATTTTTPLSQRRAQQLLPRDAEAIAVAVPADSAMKFSSSQRRRRPQEKEPKDDDTAVAATAAATVAASALLLFSDIPRENNEGSSTSGVDGDIIGGGNEKQKKKNNIFLDNGFINKVKKWDAKELLEPPPPPEDQFIMTGDMAVLFVYAFTSHSINDYVVKVMLQRPDVSLVDSIRELDPTGSIVNTNSLSVWLDGGGSDPVGVQHALEVSARESFLNHWGPLLSTEGSSCVALCSCWLLAGYIHRAFLYRNSLYCDPSQALKTTIVTWLTSAVLLTTFAITTDFVIGHVPFLQQLLCVSCHNTPVNSLFVEGPGVGYGSVIKDVLVDTNNDGGAGSSFVLSTLTQSDVMFIVDSLTVLIAWRWTANVIANLL